MNSDQYATLSVICATGSILVSVYVLYTVTRKPTYHPDYLRGKRMARALLYEGKKKSDHQAMVNGESAEFRRGWDDAVL